MYKLETTCVRNSNSDNATECGGDNHVGIYCWTVLYNCYQRGPTCKIQELSKELFVQNDQLNSLDKWVSSQLFLQNDQLNSLDQWFSSELFVQNDQLNSPDQWFSSELFVQNDQLNSLDQ
jgi:hypothetical protein